MSEFKVKSLAKWFGANGESASRVGLAIGTVKWCGVPFMGGGSELPHIQCSAGVANDLHRHLINLARVIRSDALRPLLAEQLERTIFHEDEYRAAQILCVERERGWTSDLFSPASACMDEPDLEWAYHYFVASWMGPGAKSGTKQEFRSFFPVRWTTSGGASGTRFRSAIESLEAWGKLFARWEFMRLDAFEFINNCHDLPGHAIYCDPPWPDAGKQYTHGFSDEAQARLASCLSRYAHARVVVRNGDHPLIRGLYPEDRWDWIAGSTRGQANNDVGEALIVKRRPA
jgi:site-specific DNA-adenine methylase